VGVLGAVLGSCLATEARGIGEWESLIRVRGSGASRPFWVRPEVCRKPCASLVGLSFETRAQDSRAVSRNVHKPRTCDFVCV